MTYVRRIDVGEKSLIGIRKPLLYPSERQGPGPGTLAYRFTLRKAPLALSSVPLDSASDLCCFPAIRPVLTGSPGAHRPDPLAAPDHECEEAECQNKVIE